MYTHVTLGLHKWPSKLFHVIDTVYNIVIYLIQDSRFETLMARDIVT